MTQNWKKLLSLLLVLTMLVGMMPAVFAAEEEPAAEPEQAEEILPEEPADPEIPDEPEEPATPDGPETPDDPAEPAEPEAPADPAAEKEAAPLTLKAAEALRLEDGKVLLVFTVENGAPEALTVRIAPKPAVGKAVVEDAWTKEAVAPDAAGEYLFEIAADGLAAGDWVVEAICGEAVLTVDVSIVPDTEADALAVDGYTVKLPVPAETEEPAEDPAEPEEPADEAEEPEAPENDTDFDIEIMSEAVGARKEIPVTSSLLNFSYAEYEWVHGVFLTTGFTVTSSFSGTYPDIDGLYVIARSGSTRYYLGYYPIADIGFDGYNEPYIYYPTLPVGSYDLLMGGITAAGDLVVTQPLGAKLIVLPTPEVSLGAPTDDSRHFFNLKLPKDTSGIEGLITPLYNLPLSYMLSEAVNGVFSSDVLDDGETYSFMYAGPDTTEYDTTDPDASDPNLIMLSNPAWLTVPKTTAPVNLDAYFPTGTPDVHIGESASDPLILCYKGATAKIKTDYKTASDAIDADVDDTRLTYKSGNPKVVSVDEVGNVTVLAESESPVSITVTSVAGGISDVVWVKGEFIKPKTFQFDQTKGVPDYGRKSEINDKYNYYSGHAPTYTLLLTTDSIPSGAEIPVTFTVTGGDGLKIFPGDAYDGEWPPEAEDFSNYRSTYTDTITTLGDPPRAQIHLMAVGGGHYTVTAEALGRTATCTIDVDGFSSVGYQAYPSDSAQFYRGGKTVTGWITWEGEEFIYGAGGIKPDPVEGLAGRKIFYVSPSTKQVIGTGVQKIGSKYYCFDSNYGSYNSLQTYLYEDPITHDWYTVDGMDSTDNPYTGSIGYICIAADGHLLSGWQSVDTDDDGDYDDVYYFDPDTYFMATSTWVPVRNGKGVTWVNSDGDEKDDNGKTLDNAGEAYVDGFHQINGEWYFFAGGHNKGARQTGWVYVKQDGTQWVPADSKTGIAKIYCDPDRNGAVAMSLGYGETFWAEGKEYCGHNSAYGYCIVILPGPYTGNKNAKYLDVGDGFILGPDGSITKNALVSVYGSPSFHTMYAKPDGTIAKDEWITLKGKSYYFNSSCWLEETAFSGTGLYVWDDVDWSQVTAEPAKDGSFFYWYNGEKLKNIILYNFGKTPAKILDKNGKVVADAIASGRTTVDSSAVVRTYLVDADGRVVCDSYPAGGGLYYTEEVKGKLYATRPETGEILKDGLVPIRWSDSHEVLAYGYADKNGVLARNTFKDVSELGGAVYFDENGDAVLGYDDQPLVVNGKAYLAFPDTYNGVRISVVLKPAKAGWVDASLSSASVPGIVYANKDGSLQTGLLTMPNGRKAYFTIWNRDEFRALNNFNDPSDDDPVIWRIGGKLYAFNSNYEMLTGWILFPTVGISELEPDNTSSVDSDEPILMYFDPKTGTALAGGWKNAPLPHVYYDYDLEENVPTVGAEDIAFKDAEAVNESSKTAKLYFDGNGILARNTALTISGKAYKFGPDGSSSFNAGWIDSDKMYYMLKNGQLATGRQKIDGQYYLFDSTGHRVSNALRKTGGKWYYYDMNGVQATPILSASPPSGFKQSYIGSVTGAAFTAVWAKDGSLSKIVYTGSGNPAAGESVNFGSWDPNPDPALGTYSAFTLDSKGLPMTGAVSVLEPAGTEYVARTHLFNADGSRVRTARGCMGLVPYGKLFYVMDGDIVQAQSKVTAVIINGSWDSLSAADQKTLNAYYACYLCQNSHDAPSIYVLVNPDGSVAASQMAAATVDGTTRLWHTDRFGIPMEYYLPIFKFGGKWYVDQELDHSFYFEDSEGGFEVIVKSKDNGELAGLYSAQTGKAISGSFVCNSPTGVIMLKNGKPQTGTVSVQGGRYHFYLDDEMGIFPVNWC